MAEEGEEAFEACLQQALNFLADRGFSRELRQEQKSCIKQLFTDVLAVLPTGFGKSMIFQLLALMKKDSVILVICPLKSIVNDQIKEASSMGISAGSLSGCLQTDIESGKYCLLFASAEEALAKCFLQSLKREGNTLHDNLAAIVVDESHTVETWSTGQKIRNSSKNTELENPVISSGLLHSSMLSDFKYSDISLEAFLLTVFRTSGYNSE